MIPTFSERSKPCFSTRVLCLCAAGFVGCGGEEDASKATESIEVRAAMPLAKTTVLWDKYTGRLAATDYVEVRARVSGYLESIHFDEGEIVEEGDLLFVVDRRPFEAALASATARKREAEARKVERESRLVAAKASKQQAVAQYELASANLRRAEQLTVQNAISDEEVDVRRSEVAQRAADVDAAEADVASARAGIATAKAAIETASAGVEAARLDLQYATIEAPIGGRISRELVTEGNLIVGGMGGQATKLTSIVSLDPIYCYIDANERAFVRYQELERRGERRSSREVKNPVLMRTVGETEFAHRGHMDFIDNRLDRDTATISGRAIFPNEEHELLPAQFGEVMIPGSGVIEVVLIPDSAILADQSLRYVYRVTEESKVVRQEIELGEMVDGLRQVQSGLQKDDRIVLSNLQQLRDGTEVRVAEEEEVEVTEEDGLPDAYEPVPRSEWLRQPRRDGSSKPLAEAEPSEPRDAASSKRQAGDVIDEEATAAAG